MLLHKEKCRHCTGEEKYIENKLETGEAKSTKRYEI